MVALPKLQKCFGCASLRTGTLIIGALSLVSSLVGILASIGFLAGSTARVDLVVQLLDHLPGQNVDVNCVACDDLERQFISAGIIIFGVAILICSIFSTVISACLVHGARTRNACLMKPWMILTGLNLCTPIVMLSILGWVLCAYFLLVVWNFMKEIEDGGKDYQGEVHNKSEERC